MNTEKSHPPAEANGAEISALIETLHRTEERLEDLTSGEVDTVADRYGRTILLRRAQDHMRHNEAAKQAAILNALPAHIALLDAQGRIVSVNEAWRRFAISNGIQVADYGIGSNYLETCARACGEGAAEAQQAAAGIRSVLNGSTKYFSLEYACHAPAQQRWFQMTVTPLPDDSPKGAAVMHLNITERKRTEEALRESVARLRILTAMSSDFYWESDAEHRLTARTSANKKLSAVSAFRRGAQIGERRWEIPHLSPDAAGWQAHRAVLDAHLGFRDFELSRLGADGTERHISISGDPVFDAAGAFKGYRGVGRDITERKQAAVRLGKSEERFRRYFELGLIGMAITSPASGIAEVNDKFCQILGYERAELLQKTWPELTHPDDLDADLYQFSRVLAGAIDGYTLDKRFINRSGAVVHATISVRCVRTASGAVDYFVALLQDITQRKLMENALREREHSFSAVFHGSPMAISVSRFADGKILEVNDAALRLFGYARDEMIGRTATAVGTYVNPAQRGDLIALLREHGQVEGFEMDFRRSSGAIGKLEVTGQTIELQGEQCLVAMMVDATLRKQLEAAHLRSQKMEALGTLAGGIAHDFNNVLAAIQGNADLAAEDVGPDHRAAESLNEIKKASARARELVRRITAFGRPGNAQQETVDLSAVVSEVLNLLRSTLSAAISLRKNFANDTPHVLADAGQIHEAIINLTTNAAYAFGSRAGTIEYRLEQVQVGEAFARAIPELKPGCYARLTVSDSGCGMDAATLERIFDAFYTTKPVGEGTGLGLSMVHGTMKSHGGAVTVESARGKGSSFALYFPAAIDMPNAGE